MTYPEALRRRILSALGAGMLFGSMAPLSCAENDEAEPLKPGSCSIGTGEVQCWARGTTHFNPGNTPPDAGAPPLPAALFDENGCQIRDQVRNGCCNAAVTGPELMDGQCCYGFCTGACCGRPFVVDGSSRVAALERRDDWNAPFSLEDDESLDARTRAALSRQWLADAQMEHASIASFARFTLDLLAFGAPLELVRAAGRALSDETEHAAACFAVASHYERSALGPGALRMDGVRASASLAEAVQSAVREGCIGETLAAVVVRQRARVARIAEIRAVLERIAEDEARHAELAWCFVRWAAENGGPEVRAGIAAAFRDLAVSTPPSRSEPALHAHGCLADSETRAIERTAIREIVEPCARALLSTFESTAPAQLRPNRSATCENVRIA